MEAQSPSQQSWDLLVGLKPGDKIQVQDTAGKQQRGEFSAVSADAITLTTGKGSVSVDRPRVRRIQIRSSARRTRNIVIGAAVGVALGATIDQTLGTYFRNESGQTEGARAVTYIAPIGIFAGLCAFPAYKTIYRIP